MSSPVDGDAEIRAGIRAHWHASERGDIEAEHAIYAPDAILDYPQSGERFNGRSRIQAHRGGHPAPRRAQSRCPPRRAVGPAASPPPPGAAASPTPAVPAALRVAATASTSARS